MLGRERGRRSWPRSTAVPSREIKPRNLKGWGLTSRTPLDFEKSSGKSAGIPERPGRCAGHRPGAQATTPLGSCCRCGRPRKPRARPFPDPNPRGEGIGSSWLDPVHPGSHPNWFLLGQLPRLIAQRKKPLPHSSPAFIHSLFSKKSPGSTPPICQKSTRRVPKPPAGEAARKSFDNHPGSRSNSPWVLDI